MLKGIFELGVSSLRNFFFEHPMATYAAALAYRGLFGLFPFLLILVVLASALGFSDFFDRAVEQPVLAMSLACLSSSRCISTIP